MVGREQVAAMQSADATAPLSECDCDTTVIRGLQNPGIWRLTREPSDTANRLFVDGALVEVSACSSQTSLSKPTDSDIVRPSKVIRSLRARLKCCRPHGERPLGRAVPASMPRSKRCCVTSADSPYPRLFVQPRPGAGPRVMMPSPWLRTERIVHARSTPRAARQRGASGTAGCRHERQHRHRLARQEVHRLRDGLVRREFRVAPRGDRESHRTLQGARLRLSRLRVCAVDGARAAARVAGPPSADDLLPRDRWIRGGRPRAAGGDDPHRPPRLPVARRQLPRQHACRVEHRRVRQPRAASRTCCRTAARLHRRSTRRHCAASSSG